MEGQEASILIGILGAETPDVVSGVPELDATIKRGSIPLSSFMFLWKALECECSYLTKNSGVSGTVREVRFLSLPDKILWALRKGGPLNWEAVPKL